MKQYIEFNELFSDFRKKQNIVISYIDKLKFTNILLIWATIIIFFGFIYYVFTDESSFLFYNAKNEAINKLSDSIYFSFVTATTTGFGDITPRGTFKLISIIEVVCGFLLLALVPAKLVSIKQDMILNELYEISFNEKINRLRSSLLLFRQNLSRVMEKIEENSIRKREIADLYIQFSSFEDTINEVLTQVTRAEKHEFVKDLNPVDAELILSSIIASFEKINELLLTLKLHNIDWKREINIKSIEKCIELSETLFKKIISIKGVSDKSIEEIKVLNTKAISSIKENMK